MKKYFTSASMLALVFSGVCLLNSCSKSETTVTPAPPSNEPISTVTLTATNTADNSVVKASWTMDPDANVADTSHFLLTLKANSTYNVAVSLVDSTQTPAEDITSEIYDRRGYHLFFFQPSPMAAGFATGISSAYIPQDQWVSYETNTPPYLNLAVVRTDLDNNSPALPIGLQDKFTTGAASTGYVRMVLRHQPNVKNGTYAPGSTDTDAKFKVTIQ